VSKQVSEVLSMHDRIDPERDWRWCAARHLTTCAIAHGVVAERNMELG